MATTIPIADVLAQVQFRLHLPAVGSGTFVTSSAALLLAKGAVSRLGALVNRSFGDAYFAQTATLATQAGVDLVSLPTSFKDLLSLHWVDGDKAVQLERAEVTEYTPLAKAWSPNQLPRYRIEGSVIVLTPPPAAAYSLRCAYSTGLSIATTADTIQGQAGWDEWLINDICAMIRLREDKDPGAYLALRGEAEAHILSQAAQRDRNGVTAVRDVHGLLQNDAGLFGRPADWWL